MTAEAEVVVVQPETGLRDAAEKPEALSFFQLFRHSSALERIAVVLGVVASIVHGALMPVMSVFVGDIIDSFSPGPPAALWGSSSLGGGGGGMPPGEALASFSLVGPISDIALKLVWIGLGAGAATFLQVALLNASAERQCHRIRRLFFDAVLRHELAWHDTTKSGELATRLAGDLQSLQDAIGDKLGSFLQFLSTFVAGYAVGFSADYRLTLVLIAATPLFVMAGGVAGMLTGRFAVLMQQAYAEAGGVATEALSGIRTVASFSGEIRELRRYSERLERSRAVGIRKGGVTAAALSTMFFFLVAMYALAFFYGSRLVNDGKLSAGGVITVFLAVLLGSQSVGSLVTPLSAVFAGKGAAQQVFSTISRESRIDPANAGGEKPEQIAGNVEFRDVFFSYPTRPEVLVLNGFSLKVPAGKTVALVGESGCGKSTVVGLLERFYSPVLGSVLLDGHPVDQFNLHWLRGQIGLVSQEPVLFATTIADNIRYGRETKEPIPMAEVVAAAKLANAHDFIDKLPQGYQTLVGELGTQLSGGQKQRIAIARALIRRPKILLLDECTSALDSESERLVQEALDKASTRCTTIVIAHRLSTIQNADLIAFIQRGVVQELGTHAELMALNGLYSQAVRKQALAEAEEEGGEEEEGTSGGATTTTTTTTTTLTTTLTGLTTGTASLHYTAEKRTVKHPILRTLRTNKPEAGWMAAGAFGAISNGVLFPIFTIIYAKVVNVLLFSTGDDMLRESDKYSLYFLLLAVGIALTAALNLASLARAGEWLTFRIRKLLLRAMLRQDVSWFDWDNHSTGALATRLAVDASSIQGASGSSLGTFLQIIATFTTGLVIAFTGSWKVALVVTACVPVVVLGTVLSVRTQFGVSDRTKRAYEGSGNVVTEALQNIKTVASLGIERTIMIPSYIELIHDPHIRDMRSSTLIAAGRGFSEFGVFCINALAFWYGSTLVQDGEIDFAQMMRAVMGITYTASLLGQITAWAPDFGKAALAANNTFALIDHVPPIDSAAPGGKKPDGCKGLVAFKDVSFRYPARPNVRVLSRFSLKVPAGKTVALVGPSGCGKSTVVGLLERFYSPVAGSITVDGEDIGQLNLHWLRGQIGLVSQEPVLFATTIADNIRYGKPGATQDEIVEAAKQANAHGFISALPEGYQTLVGERGSQLSGGQKQRIAIARALIRNPKILLLDEATSALDTESEKVVQEALDRARIGRTTIVIAHRLSTIQNADLIAVLNRGRVIEAGTHAELMNKHGLYSVLASRQQLSDV